MRAPAKTILALLLLVVLTGGCQRGNELLDLDVLAGQARAGEAKALKKLVELLAIEAGDVNDRAYRIVIELGSAAIPPLLAEVASGDTDQREHVIAALGSLKAREAVAPISAILARRELGRRYVAAWALGEIGEAAGVAPLIVALDDEDGEVRKYATRSLIKLGHQAVAPLVAYLPSAPARGAAGAIRALGDIADPSALTVLLGQVSGPNRDEVFLALGKLKDPRAEQTLIAGLADRDWKVRMNAAMALGPLGSAAAVPGLRKTLEDEIHVVREWSARSLEIITGTHLKYRNEKGEYVAPYSIYH